MVKNLKLNMKLNLCYLLIILWLIWYAIWMKGNHCGNIFCDVFWGKLMT